MGWYYMLRRFVCLIIWMRFAAAIIHFHL